jgi:AraC-like DNA-binding protein
MASHCISLIHTGTRVVFERQGKGLVVRAEYLGCADGGAPQYRQSTVVVLRKIVSLASEEIPTRVEVSAPRGCRGDEMERLLGPDLVLGCARDQLVMDYEVLSVPLRAAASADVQPEQFSEALTCRKAFEQMRELIAIDRPTIAAVAAALGMNVRTLQRRLAKWGLTFEQLVDEYRKMHGLSLLVGSVATVTDIAFRLGYSDSTHFTRAVRRWTGRSPREFRAGCAYSAPWRLEAGSTSLRRAS